jgi:type IV pilus assembly protein PilB
VRSPRTGAVAVSAADESASEKRLLGEVLVDRRHLTPAQLSEALLQQRVSGKRLGTLLVELGALDERDLADALGEHFGVPVVDLRHTPPDEVAIARLV